MAFMLSINLYGVVSVRSDESGGIEVRSPKHRAIFALLATSPNGRCSRQFLQDMLWSRAQHDGGRGNLRRALSDLRKLLGPNVASVLVADRRYVWLDLARVRLVDPPANDTVYLGGLDIAEPALQEWVQRQRAGGDRSVANRPAAELRATV